MKQYFDTVFNQLTSRPLVGAQVRVLNNSDGSIATIYSSDGGASIDNPFTVQDETTSSPGFFSFWADAGFYDIEYLYGGSVIKTIKKVDLGTDLTHTEVAATGGAALVGKAGGGTVQDHIDAITTAGASTGAAVVPFRPAGTGAVDGNAQKKLRERVSPLDFGAAGDADPDDNTAGTDDTDAVQAALDYCATHPGTALHLAGLFYKVSNVRVPPRDDRRRWFIFGEGGGFVNPATATSETPCLYHSSLAASGDASRTYAYSTGVTLVGVKFHGGGFGVGYAHMIAGFIRLDDCYFSGLEDGFLTIGVAGIKVRDTGFNECTRAAHAAKKADYVFTASYTQETSTGWNDGYFIDGGFFRMCDYGLLYKGSDNEGVVGVRGMVWTGALESYVETYGNMKTMEIVGNWCEYTRAAEDGSAHADIIRFWRSTGADTGSESPARFVVELNNFFLSAPSAVGGVNTYAINYIVNSRANVAFRNNVITAATGAVYTGCLWNSIGTSGAPIAAATVTPQSTANVNADGYIAFTDTDLDDFGLPYSVLYMNDGTKTYLLTRRGTASTGVTNYDIHEFSLVWSPQFPPVTANWLNSTTPWSNRIKPLGITCDFTTNVSGMTAPAGTVTVWSGISGGVTSFTDGSSIGGEAIMENNVFQNFDMTKIYQQREFGRVRMAGNIKRA